MPAIVGVIYYRNILQMLAEEIPKLETSDWSFFCQNLRPYGIQNNVKKTDGVDRV